MIDNNSAKTSFNYETAFFHGAILGLLMIGSLFYEERLSLGLEFFSLNFVIVSIVLAFIIRNRASIEVEIFSFFFIPFCFGFLYLGISNDFEYATYKLVNFVFVTGLLCLALSIIVNKNELELFASNIVTFLFFLLVLTILYKFLFGFFDRQVRFLLNGPIVFARLMGVGLFLTIAYFSGGKRLILSCMFFLAILWTQSKGPALSVFVVFGVLTLFVASFTQRIMALVLVFGVVMVISLNFELLKEIEELSRIFLIVDALQGNVSGQNYGSFGSRIDAFSATVSLIGNTPLGVGVGSWASYNQHLGVDYPHNLFLELTSEFGLLLGFFMLLPALCFFKFKVNAFFFVWLFFLLSHLVSGDLLDSRFLYLFAYLNMLVAYKANKI